MASSVEVSVEALQECQIQEVTLDGHEIYVQPLTLSENLTKLAHKIDFSKDESAEKGKPTSEGQTESEEEEEDEKTAITTQQSLWPWDSVRTKLRAASTELGVLADVLTLARQKTHMIADPVVSDYIDSKNSILMISKKRALQAAGSILIRGYERLHRSQEAAAKCSLPDFHFELLKLRQQWRLKKVGSGILGDLSYKSVGSRYWQSGSFEVTKTEETSESTNTMNAQLSQISSNGSSSGSSLSVTVPSELEGTAYMHITIIDSSNNLDNNDKFASSALSDMISIPKRPVSQSNHWQIKLESAQNVLYCREIFSRLAQEAVQSVGAIPPHVVVGNQISCHLFPDVRLLVALSHNTGRSDVSKGTVVTSRVQNRLAGMGVSRSDSFGGMPSGVNASIRNSLSGIREDAQDDNAEEGQDKVLELSVHQLQRELHLRTSQHSMPHPVTAAFCPTKRRRLAGPRGLHRNEISELTPSESMLDTIIKQAKHSVVRQRVLNVIDTMARTIHSPQIYVHWSNVGSDVNSLLKVGIGFSGYDIMRTMFTLRIHVDTVEIYCRDGRVLTLSSEEQEISDFIHTQLAEHHIFIAQTLAKSFGWKILTSSSNLGVGDREPMGSALGIMLASPFNDRILSIRSSPVNGVKVKLQTCPNVAEGNISTAAPKPKWSGMNELFQEINLAKLEGTNFAQKLETIMACLIPERAEFGLY